MAENAENDPGPGDVAAPLLAHHQRLDATTGRDVVFCYQCQAEWWRDEHGIMPCPSCGQDITEIVNPNSDIRPPQIPPHPRQSETTASQSNHMNSIDRRSGNNSDPEEEDIQPYALNMPGALATSSGPNPRRRQRADSDEPDFLRQETERSFGTLMQTLLTPAMPLQRPPNAQGQNNNRNAPNNQAPPPNPNRPTTPFSFFGGTRGPRPGTVVTTRIVLSNGGPPVTHVYGNMPGQEPPPNLATIFTEMMNNMGGPAGAAQNAAGGPADGNPFNGVNPFHALLASLLNPDAAVHGDAVYTQEALDRVISQLMDQHQSSGAAPPAPREAIDKLKHVKVDEEMLGPEGKANCSVCIEDVALNDEVVQLPCKHWFHDQCVKYWLENHNSCPICRTPISEIGGREGQGESANPSPNQNQSQNQQSGDAQPPRSRTPPFVVPYTFFNEGPRRGTARERSARRSRLDGIRRAGGVTYDADNEPPPRMPGAYSYSPPSNASSRPADGTPGGRSFADPGSGAFLDFLNAPSPGTRRHDEDNDRYRGERAGHRLRRENSFPLAHEHHTGALGHNPFVDTFDGAARNRAPGPPSDGDSWRTTRSGGSRDSRGSRASAGDRDGAGAGGGGISGVLGGLWRRFSGQSSQGQGPGSSNQGGAGAGGSDQGSK